MTRRIVAAGALAAVVTAAACKPKVTPAPPVSSDVVVLLPDPDDGHVGAATVSTPQGAVELSAGEHATRIAAGQAPGAPTPMTTDEIRRRFGDAMTALPLAPRTFLLYFETGADTLTPESEALVPEIVAFVRGRPVPDVSIIGHTDTTGDADRNVELGMRRAELIRDVLVRGGLDPGQVDIASHGEADLLVPTPDDTPQPKNRRVEVTVR